MKKKIRSKKTTVLALALSVISGFAHAQSDSKKKKKDPFTRGAEAVENSKLGEPETTVVIGVQLARVPTESVRKWDEENLDGNEWRKRVQVLVEEGKAEIVDSVAGGYWSGARGKYQSVLELRSPSELKKINDSTDEPLYPVNFETLELGIYFEADPVLSASKAELDLNFAFSWSRYLGETVGARPTTDRTEATDLINPHVSFQKITTQINMAIGEYRVLSRLKPNDPEKKEEFDIVVFGRTDLMVVSPVSDSEKLKTSAHIKLRGTWAEVDAKVWHDELQKNTLAAWFGGKAWENLQKWEKNGKAKVLASPVIEARSGQRAKVEVGEFLQFQNSFPELGEKPEEETEQKKIEMKERVLGHVLEIDPVMSNNGILHLNLAAKSTSLHGHSVSYRRQEGDKWVPSVQFPKFYGSSLTSQVFLGENADTLIGVGTPPLENGQPDTSRKWVFFVHNDTFDSE